MMSTCVDLRETEPVLVTSARGKEHDYDTGGTYSR